MTLPDVIISALVLGISTQVTLQGWICTTARAARSEQRQQQLQLFDQQVLSAGRLLPATRFMPTTAASPATLQPI